MAEMFERHPFRRRDLLHGLGGLAQQGIVRGSGACWLAKQAMSRSTFSMNLPPTAVEAYGGREASTRLGSRRRRFPGGRYRE
jgi:hypothetical protein